MDYKVIAPENPSALPCPMLKFFIVTDDAAVTFIVEDKFSEKLLREELSDLSETDLKDIVNLVEGFYSEDEIGQGALSKVTRVAQIQRILSS
jgi:hypothetical protein